MDENFIFELKRRIKEPWCSAFHGYFWGVIFLFAIISFVVPILSTQEVSKINIVASSLSTYFIALIASSSIEVILSFTTKNKASFTIYSFLVLFSGFILLLLSNFLGSGWNLIPAIIGIIIAFLLWIIANADNPKLNDENYATVIKENVGILKYTLENENEHNG